MCYSEGLDMPGVSDSDLASAWGPEGTKTKVSELNRIIYITEKPVQQHAQSATFGLFIKASMFWLTGWFHIHLFLFI